MATTWKEAEPGGAATVPSAETPDRTLEVVVVYTTTQATVQALKIASTLARGLSARIRLLVPQMVPYILPLSSPPISEDGMRQRLRKIVSEAAVETRIDIRVCRNQWEMLEFALKPRSLVVLGGRRWWWPSPETRLARRLRRMGHQVVLSSIE